MFRLDTATLEDFRDHLKEGNANKYMFCCCWRSTAKWIEQGQNPCWTGTAYLAQGEVPDEEGQNRDATSSAVIAMTPVL